MYYIQKNISLSISLLLGIGPHPFRNSFVTNRAPRPYWTFRARWSGGSVFLVQVTGLVGLINFYSLSSHPIIKTVQGQISCFVCFPYQGPHHPIAGAFVGKMYLLAIAILLTGLVTSSNRLWSHQLLTGSLGSQIIQMASDKTALFLWRDHQRRTKSFHLLQDPYLSRE